MLELATIAAGLYLASLLMKGRPAPPEPQTTLQPRRDPPPVAPIRPSTEYQFPLFSPVRGAYRTTQEAARSHFAADPGPLFELAGIMWPARRYLNKLTFVSGRPGTGKTVLQQLMMASAAGLFQTMREQARAGLYPGEGRMRWLVVDPTNSYLPYLYRTLPGDIRIIRASPNDADGWAWDVAKDVNSDALNDAFQTALFPDSLFAKSGDPFWYSKARELTKSLVEVFHYRGSAWEFCDIIIPIKYPQFLRPVLKQSPLTIGKVRHELVGKLGRDIIATASSVVNRMAVAAALWRKAKRRFSLADFLESRDVVHFSFTPEMIASLSGIANALTHILILKGISRTDEYDHTVLWLDESRYLADLAGLEDLAARGRGAGFGAIISAQGTPGLISKWGESRVKELLDLICSWVTLSAGYETALAYSHAVGLVEGIQESYGRSETYGHTSTTTTTHGSSNTSSWNAAGAPHGGSSGSSWSVSHSSSDSHSITNSQNFQLTIKDAILPSEITNLPLANQDLLTGFAFNPDVGAFEFDVPFLDHFRSLVDPPFSAMPTRPAADQRLDPWRLEDLTRLKLEPTPELIKAIKTTWKHFGETS